MSKVVVYMAVSADGFIAGLHDETPWSEAEWESFAEFARSADVCLIGRSTYEIMKRSNEFVDGARFAVVSRNASFDAGGLPVYNIQSPSDLPKGKLIAVMGGGELNGSLLALGLVDEVILDIEPVILGAGKHLFGARRIEPNLELVQTKRFGTGTVQQHYRIRQ